MRLKIHDGSLYADGMFLSHAEPGNGTTHIPRGLYDVTVSFSHAHGRDLPQAHGLGWIGTDLTRDAVILGSVRGRITLLPSLNNLARLQALVEQSEENGRLVTLEVM